MDLGAVLIYYIVAVSFNTHNNTLTSGTQQFSDVASCQRAIAELVRMESESVNKGIKIHVKATCLSK